MLRSDSVGRAGGWQTLRWTDILQYRDRLNVLVKRWADNYRLPESVVGLSDANTSEDIDITKSPAELQWPRRVEVFAVPNDENFAEKGERVPENEGAAAHQEEPIKKKSSEATASKKENLCPAAMRNASASSVAADIAGKDSVRPAMLDLDASPAPAAKRPRKKVDSSPELLRTPVLGDIPSPEPSSTTPVPASAALSRTPGAPVPRPSSTTPVSPSVAVSGSNAASASSERPKPLKAATASRSTAAQAGPVRTTVAKASHGAIPGDDEKILFKQTNPKRSGASSYTRYDKYKAATTIREAYTMGAMKGDIKHDWEKGYFSRQ